MVVRLVALKPLRYGKTWVKVGDAFSASRTDALVLKGAKIAKDYQAPPAPPQPPVALRSSRYRTAAMSAPAPEPIPEPTSEPVTPVTMVPPEYVPADMPVTVEATTETISPENSDESEPPKKRTYKRRDLTAEDSE